MPDFAPGDVRAFVRSDMYIGAFDVCYARSYNFSTMGVRTSGTTNATFDVPKSCETGVSTLQVIVNGIASAGTAVKPS